MGAQLSAATREVAGVLVSVLDRQPGYRASLVGTLRRYQSDADIPPSQALQWTSEKLCKDLCDPMALQQPFADALSASALSPASSLSGLDKASLSSCIGRAAMLVLEELKLDLAVHKRLFDCAAEGRLDRLRRLEPFVDMDYTDSQGATVLMLAAHYGHTALVAYLLALQPPPAVDAQDQYGWTALMHASRNGHLSCVRLVTAHSASVDMLNASRCTALMCAADNGHFAVVRHLLALQAEVDAVSRSGDTALLQAAKGGHLSIMKALVAAGANVSHCGKRQQSAAMVAASQARWDIVEYLVSEGAAVDGVDDEGRSICHYEVKPTIAQPLDASLRAAVGVSGGGQLAAAIQRGIVGRFNRTIQRSVQSSGAHRQLGSFHRQQLSGEQLRQQPHSKYSPSHTPNDSTVRWPATGRQHDDERPGNTTAADDEEIEEDGIGAETLSLAVKARLTHKMGVQRADGAAGDGGIGEDSRQSGRRRTQRQHTRERRSAERAQADGSMNVSVGQVVQGEDDEDESSNTASVAAAAASAAARPSAPPLASVARGDVLLTLGRVPQSLSARASSDLDLDVDIDDDALLLVDSNNSITKDSSSERDTATLPTESLVSRQPIASPIGIRSMNSNSNSAGRSMERPVNPTPRQAAQRNSARDNRSAAVEAQDETSDQQDSRMLRSASRVHPTHHPATTPTGSHGRSRSHRRHRSLSTSPTQLPPHRSRPSPGARLAALRQATFLPTSFAARALRHATEDGEDNEDNEQKQAREDDVGSDDQLEQPATPRHERGAEKQKASKPAEASSTERTRSGGHRSVHHSHASIHSPSSLSPGRCADGDSVVRSRRDTSSSSEYNSNSHSDSNSSSSFESSSSSESSLSPSASPRRSPVRPLHSRSSTTSFKSVFSSRSHFHSHNSPALIAIDPVALSPGSSPSLPLRHRRRSSAPSATAANGTVLSTGSHSASPTAHKSDTLTAADTTLVDSDNIHLNPTPQHSPHPTPLRAIQPQPQPQPTAQSPPQSHLAGPNHYGRAHSRPPATAPQPHNHGQTTPEAESSEATQLTLQQSQQQQNAGATDKQQQHAGLSQQHLQWTAADSGAENDQTRRSNGHRLKEAGSSESSTAGPRAEVSNIASDSSTPRFSPQCSERSELAQPDSQPQSGPHTAAAIPSVTIPASSSSSSPPPPSSFVSALSSYSLAVSQPSLRPPPPIVLAHSDWRAHLDSTPVPAWLQHYRIEGAAYNALSHLSFRQLYSLTEDDCRRMLGRRRGETLFACTRDYARKVQATYANHNRAARQQLPVPVSHSADLAAIAAASSMPSQTTHSQAVTIVFTVPPDDRRPTARETMRRNGKRRNRPSIHTAIVISPPDLPSEQLVFVPPPAPVAPVAPQPASPLPGAPRHHSSAALAEADHTLVATQLTQPNAAATAVTTSTAAAATAATVAAVADVPVPTPSPTTAAAASSLVRSVSLSPTGVLLPQSSSFGALTDQLHVGELLDRSNAWLARSVLSMFKDQQQQQQQQHTAAGHSTAGNGVGVNNLLSGSRSTHARLSSILSGAGALHELDPQPF